MASWRKWDFRWIMESGSDSNRKDFGRGATGKDFLSKENNQKKGRNVRGSRTCMTAVSFEVEC